MPIYAVNCTTESAIYVMELRLWEECLWGNDRIESASLMYMRYFYEMYPNAQNRPQPVDDLTMIFITPKDIAMLW